MIPPTMAIFAGPPGGGKSTVFSPRTTIENFFNADDRAAELNGGSYRAISISLRQRVNLEFESFVLNNIAAQQSFALETTLRSRITFCQAKLAKSAGFEVSMAYIALESFDLHLERVKRRANAGGHSASEHTLRSIYDNSLLNLAIAFCPSESGVDLLRVFDNTGADPRLILQSRNGRITELSGDVPKWLQSALRWSDTDLLQIRKTLTRSEPHIFGA